MIDQSSLEKFDSQGMHKTYDIWPEIAKKSYERKNEKIRFNEISHIVFAGMGGSGAIGDIFEAILSKTNIHVTLVKGYHLPNTVNSKTYTFKSLPKGLLTSKLINDSDDSKSTKSPET